MTEVMEKYFTQSVNKEMSLEEIFVCGWNACKQAQKEKRRARNAKTYALDVYDFAKALKNGQFYCKYVLHENGKQITTNGRMLLVHHADYDAYKEGKVLDKDGNTNADIWFPNYKRVLPYDMDAKSVDEGLSMSHICNEVELSLDDLKNLLAPYKKLRNYDRLLNTFVTVDFGGGEVRRYSMAILQGLYLFKSAYPECKSFYSSTHEDAIYDSHFYIDRQTGDIYVYMLCKLNPVTDVKQNRYSVVEHRYTETEE